MPAVSKRELLAGLTAPPGLAKIWRTLDEMIGQRQEKVFALDDDPTGTQTVHGIPVYTAWDETNMRAAFGEASRLVYILTNTRALPAEQAAEVNRQIATNLSTLALEYNRQVTIIHRSDSTLRGHYPLEAEVTRQVIEQHSGPIFNGEILIPCFPEGGRMTIGDVHWVETDGWLTPVAETEFAGDHTFAFTQSNLTRWIEEKTAGRVQAGEVVSVSLQVLRQQGSKAVRDILISGEGFQHYVVNAVDYDDIASFTLGLLQAEALGKRFLLRTAASFVQVRSGIKNRPPLTRHQLLGEERRNGLIIVGSHVSKTTRQLQLARQVPGVDPIELDVQQLLTTAAEAEVSRALNQTERSLAAGRTPLVYTSRQVQTAGLATGEANLNIAQRVSQGIVQLVSRLEAPPAWLIAKGGITSSDVATHALGIKRAVVLGQIRPGIPVWSSGQESRFPGLPYIIFPGNVGGDHTLQEIILELLG